MVKKPYVPREQKPIERIVWSQEQVNNLTADFTKTIETLIAELNRCHKERKEYMLRLLEEDFTRYSTRDGIRVRIQNIAQECFK